MSITTEEDLVEKLFTTESGRVSNTYRVQMLQRHFITVGDITTLTVEQFNGMFGTEHTRIVQNRLKRNSLAFKPVESSDLYREGVKDSRLRVKLYSIGVGSLSKLSQITLAQFLRHVSSPRRQYAYQHCSPFGASSIARLEKVMYENGFRFKDGGLSAKELFMLRNNLNGTPTGGAEVNGHDVVTGQPIFRGEKRRELLSARRERLLAELAEIEKELSSV